eukprot:UN26336
MSILFFVLYVIYISIINSLEIDITYAVDIGQHGEGFVVFHNFDCTDDIPSRFMPDNCMQGVLWIRGSDFYPINLYYQKHQSKMVFQTSKSPNMFYVERMEEALTPKEIQTRIRAEPRLCSPDHRDLYFEAQEI